MGNQNLRLIKIISLFKIMYFKLLTVLFCLPDHDSDEYIYLIAMYQNITQQTLKKACLINGIFLVDEKYCVFVT